MSPWFEAPFDKRIEGLMMYDLAPFPQNQSCSAAAIDGRAVASRSL